jgi:phenylalanyl-tRNA synthetase beta chain
MRISYNWLRQYHRLDLSPDKVAELLTGCGLEVESADTWESVRGGLKGVVIGEVLTCERHPNSDHLSLTTVDIGAGAPLRIVCGAANVASGQKVPVATLGSTLFFGDKEITLQKTKIRGEVSEGMICAEDELGLGESHAGIMVLSPEAVPGTSGATYFGVETDVIFTIGLTPNRVDAASHLGVARDLVAVYNNYGKESLPDGPYEYMVSPSLKEFRIDENTKPVIIRVEDAEACPRYSGLTMSGITVGPSPTWLKNRLESIGLRSINNIVDITNYVLMETGQPLHAFDYDKIKGSTVVVRKYSEKRPFTTLDGIERQLTSQDLMICDEAVPMCMAGVFGGIHSGVTSSTTTLFLESACFDPVHIRRTSRHHGLQTDASFRFERGSNIDITADALKRAAMLIKMVAGGTVSSEIIDVYPQPRAHCSIEFSFQRMDALIGKRLDRGVVKNILKDLSIGIVKETDPDSVFPDGALWLDIPAFKVDVTREADVIEEVLRIFGYNNIDLSNEIRMSLKTRQGIDPEYYQETIADLLVAKGYYEMMNNSLTSSANHEANEVYPESSLVKVLNPISRDLDRMRRTLLYGGLGCVAYNINRKIHDIRFFEFGRVYALSQDPKEPLSGYHEETHLLLLASGRILPENWLSRDEKLDFFDIKEMVMTIARRLGLNTGSIKFGNFSNPDVSQGIEIFHDEVCIGHLGAISDRLLRQSDIRQPVIIAELNWDALLSLVNPELIRYRGISKFPEVRRDLALLVDQKISFSQLEELAFKTESKLLKSVGLFDVYEGDKIARGMKSYAMKFILRDDEKTLTDKEIEKVMSRLVNAFSLQFKAQLR